MGELTIGSLADEAGVNVETIRYYQRRGLMPEPDKPAQGYRRYDATTVKRVRFIKRAQALGFTLEEIGGLLKLDEAHAFPHVVARAVRVHSRRTSRCLRRSRPTCRRLASNAPGLRPS